MKPRKPKPSEPSVRDKLSAKFDADLLADYEVHGSKAIEQAREKSPEKYLETVGRRIAAVEPTSDGFESCKSMEEIGIKLLESVGFPRDIQTPSMIQAAIEANDAFIAKLGEIGQEGVH